MAIVIENILKAFGKNDNERKVLDGVSLKINEGDFLAICGKSGAGKSTLMHILGMLDVPDKGKYFLDETDVLALSDGKKAKLRNAKIGFVLQDFGLIEGESVSNNVRIPLLLGKCKLRDIQNKVLDKLCMLGIEDLAKKDVSLLSGGEKQRVAIARAIVGEPEYIFADEPTGSLDSENAVMVMDIFKKIRDKGKTIVIVTHDEELAKQCDKIIYICDGHLTM